MKYVRYGLVCIFVLALIVSGLGYYAGKPTREFKSQLERLRTELEARETLGPPSKVIHPGEEAGFVEDGYPGAAHPVSHHALVYFTPFNSQDGFSDETLFPYVNADLMIDGYKFCGT